MSSSCTPPNGVLGRYLRCLSSVSIASNRSALTILTSSMMSRSISWITLLRCLRICIDEMSCLRISSVGRNGVNGSWKSECSVVPPALMAATPVGAATTICFVDVCCIFCRSVVFPVPAFPVRNMDLLVLFM